MTSPWVVARNCNIIAAGGLSIDAIGCASVGVHAGYAGGKPESQWRSGSFPDAALVIQTFRGHANLGPDEWGTLVMDAGR